MKTKQRLLLSLSALVICSALAISWAAIPAQASGYSRYDFTYSFTDGSQDKYYGYVFAPTGFLAVGSSLSNQPQTLGGGKIDGYYYITAETTGYDSSYDAQEYITSYYDGNTGKTSYTLYSSTGQQTNDHSLYVADRRYSTEQGYVYDPSVPDDDAFFGNSEVCYYFNPGKDQGNDFLAAYITDLSYWDQPDRYPSSCSEVASAIVLSYWDSHGYSNLILADWQNSWPDDTANSPSSYVNFIGTLAYDMNWTWYGTYVNAIGSGLLKYASSQGYSTSSSGSSGFTYKFDDVMDYRSSSWNDYKAAIDAGQPVIVDLWWTAGGHSTVGRGYWNDGHILTDFGWGTGYTNQKIDWFQNYVGYSYWTACVTDFTYLYYSY
jgi:hypothetical protein